MKLALSISLVVAGLAFETAALPNTYSEPHSFFDKRGIPARFEVTGHETINGVKSTTVENKNMSALYVIPDDLKNWPWWCGEDRSYCNAAWAPTVGEGNALAQWLEDRGDADCTIERPQNSNADGYTAYVQVNNHAKVGMFFTHFGDTDRAWKGEDYKKIRKFFNQTRTYYVPAATFPCVQLGYILRSLIEACQCNGRVLGSTPLPNCWIKSMSFTGDQNSPPGGGNAYPGAGVGIAPYP